MRRTRFIASAAATAGLVMALPTAAFAGVEQPKLKAFEDEDGEVYVAYSASVVEADHRDQWSFLNSDVKISLTELPSGTILSNQSDEEPFCQKTSCEREKGDTHDCLDVDKKLLQMQASIDAGEWHDYRGNIRDLVEVIWTSYGDG